jgi:drug/metabolite transporter (DMT)-like permease
MLPAILTALFFAASGICGRRAAVVFGSLRGNAFRLLLATLALGLVSWCLGPVDFTTRAAQRLLVSGVIGFGLGDVGLFLAYPKLGSRLTLLINLCSAPLFGAVIDGRLTGARVSGAQGVAGLMILAGVGLALGSGLRRPSHEARGFITGAAAALVAGFGQGCGAAVTRWAKVAAREDGIQLAALQEAFVRVLPGLAFGILVWQISKQLAKVQPRGKARASEPKGPGWPWLLGAALFGPVLGVTAFQWALGVAPSAVVLAFTATTPILVMPLAMWLEKDRPSQAAVAGALVAVAGVVWMSLLPA